MCRQVNYKASNVNSLSTLSLGVITLMKIKALNEIKTVRAVFKPNANQSTLVGCRCPPGSATFCCWKKQF